MDPATNQQDALLKWIRESFDLTGKSRKGLAEALGQTPPQVSNLIAGKKPLYALDLPIIARYFDRSLPDEFSVLLAKAYQFGEIQVTGRFALGVWIETDTIGDNIAAGEGLAMSRSADSRYAHLDQKAFVMSDNSFNAEVPKGSPVLWVPYWSVKRQLAAGDTVCVDRYDANKVERTLRRVIKSKSPDTFELATNTTDRGLLNADGSQKTVRIQQKNGSTTTWVDLDNPKVKIEILGLAIEKQVPIKT